MPENQRDALLSFSRKAPPNGTTNERRACPLRLPLFRLQGRSIVFGRRGNLALEVL